MSEQKYPNWRKFLSPKERGELKIIEQGIISLTDTSQKSSDASAMLRRSLRHERYVLQQRGASRERASRSSFV